MNIYAYPIDTDSNSVKAQKRGVKRGGKWEQGGRKGNSCTNANIKKKKKLKRETELENGKNSSQIVIQRY